MAGSRGAACGQGAQGECLATGDACERALGEFALVLGGDPFGARTGQAGLGVGELGSRAFAGTEPTAGDRRLGLEGIDLHACEGERLLGEQALHVGEAEAVEQFAAAGSEARARAFGLRLRRGVAAVRLEVEQGRAQLQRKDRVAVIEIALGTWGAYSRSPRTRDSEKLAVTLGSRPARAIGTSVSPASSSCRAAR